LSVSEESVIQKLNMANVHLTQYNTDRGDVSQSVS